MYFVGVPPPDNYYSVSILFFGLGTYFCVQSITSLASGSIPGSAIVGLCWSEMGDY